MTSTGLLIVTNPTRIARILPVIQQHVTKTLYVQYYPNRQQLLVPSSIEAAALAPRHGQTIIGLYSQTNTFCQNLDVRVLLQSTKDPLSTTISTEKPIGVVIFDKLFDRSEVDHFMTKCLKNTSALCKTVTLDTLNSKDEKVEEATLSETNGKSEKMYANVVLGGTFDRLHPGHKILLSEAVLRCTSKLTVGVTDTPMLISKKLWELIEPCQQRMDSVREFLQDIDPTLQYEIVPINDPFGPTKEDPNLELIVVSEETSKGGAAVNALRAKSGLRLLDVHTVALLKSDVDAMHGGPAEYEEEKISSSNQRLRLLGTRIREPQPRPNLPPRPYVIGLTGGIASGKSWVAEHLRGVGAGVVSCDGLAHTLYAPGEPLHAQIRQAFGEGVVKTDGEIDRAALGAIVFADKSELEKLNKLVWPALLERTKQEISRLHAAGKSVVVIEAAVLLQAGWAEHCHEVWSCIIPLDEAVKRLSARNGLSEAEARKRIESQPSNSEQIAIANVVVSSLWSADYTKRQVLRAWNTLQEKLSDAKL